MARKTLQVAVVAMVKELISATVATVIVQGNVLKAIIVPSIAISPVVGDSIIMELLPASSEWYIVTVI